MTKLKVTEDISKSLDYIISHFNANDLTFLYENYRTLNQIHNLKALKYIKKEDLIRCFFDGYIVLKALREKDLPLHFMVKEESTNMLLDVERIGEYYLAYKEKEEGSKYRVPYPLTVDMVLNLINTGSWEIVN